MDFSEVRENAHQFSVFHVNLRSLSVHHDELRLLLNALKCCFDIIGISETKEPSDGFLNNVTLDGYDLHSKYSNSAAGGVAIYLRSNLDYIIRDNLSIVEDEFETLWVEIKNNKFQNVLRCCAYRDPNTDVEKFINYMDRIMTKIVKENKLGFCMGDFNVNLLNYNVHNPTNDFVDSMLSNYLLPYILHPTRVTDHSATVIDNIFSNNTVFESVSGNIMTHMSDHFPQFIILNKININYKNCSYAKHDFSKFNEQAFINTFEEQNLNFVHDKNLSLNSKFDKFYQSLSSHVDNHAPPKKMNKKRFQIA